MSEQELIVGAEYHVEHVTMGRFQIRVGAVDGRLAGDKAIVGERVEGEITAGEAREGGRLAGAVGDRVVLGAKASTFTPIICVECNLTGPCVGGCPSKGFPPAATQAPNKEPLT